MTEYRPRFWNQGAPTDRAIKVFTQGDCWALAGEIADLTPLRLYNVGDGSHWVAGDGKRFLDITGVSSRSSLLRRWEAFSLVLATPSEIEWLTSSRRTGDFTFRDLDRRRLRDAANRVIAENAEVMGLVRTPR